MAKMKVRRAIIREWMSLAREKRQSGQQALAFAKAAVQRHSLPRADERRMTSSGDGYGRALDDPSLRQRLPAPS